MIFFHLLALCIFGKETEVGWVGGRWVSENEAAVGVRKHVSENGAGVRVEYAVGGPLDRQETEVGWVGGRWVSEKEAAVGVRQHVSENGAGVRVEYAVGDMEDAVAKTTSWR